MKLVKFQEGKMRTISFRNWGAARLIRLVAGLGFIIFGLASQDGLMFTVVGALFTVQALLNLSCCCGGGSCDTGVSRTKTNRDESSE